VKEERGTRRRREEEEGTQEEKQKYLHIFIIHTDTYIDR